MLDTSYQGVKRLLVLVYRDSCGAKRVTTESHRRYFLRRVKTENYNIEIDGRIFMISQLMTLLSNTLRLGKYQQDKVMIIKLVVY